MVKKKDKNKVLLISFTGLLIILSAVFCRMHPFYILPLMVSLFVMAFQSEANRYSILAGSLNSLIYTAVYVSFGIYGTAIQAAFFSFPVQLITFLRWNKNAYNHTVIFKKMSVTHRGFLYGSLLILWLALCITFIKMDYEYAVLDSGATLLGFVIPILTMLAYVEYTYLWPVQAVFNLLLNVQLVMSDNSRIPYLIYSVYSAFCIVMAFFNVRKYYKEQQKLKGE